MRAKIVTVLAAVLMLMLSTSPVPAAGVSSADGTIVSSGNGAPVTSADSTATGDHTLALSVWMLAIGVLTSPVTYGASFALVDVAWPAFIGSAQTGIQALK